MLNIVNILTIYTRLILFFELERTSARTIPINEAVHLSLLWVLSIYMGQPV
jgi:flagellar biosynthesis protein FliP